MRKKNNYTLTKKYRYWWRDKERSFKVRCDFLEDYENKLIEAYGLKNMDDLRFNKMNVSVYYGLRLNRGTFLIRIKGKLGKIFLQMLDIIGCETE